MAGSVLAISTTSNERENYARDLQISPVINEWQVEYARFINCSSSVFPSTHPSLVPVPKNRLRRNWISTADAASVKLIYERSSAGTDDAVLVLSLLSKTLEVHYISKMHFSWPQVSCMSGFPSRGTRAVFLSYKDGVGQMQKFALRFSAIDETEKFMNVVKEILQNGSSPQLQCPELYSEMSSEAEAISSHATISRSDGEWQCTQSTDNSTQLMLTSSALKASQDSEPHECLGDHEVAKTEPVFPPSFSQLMNSCRPAGFEGCLPSSIVSFDVSLADYLGAAAKTGSGDIKTQFVQYLEGTPFKELLATVENVISQLGDDVVL
ncbi:hypothetical protein C2S53_007025 [Perilla frutescens var. hirtella]|uniref:Poor homologous synapsis 1 PH domain-containing protein n=1 Tax=Perilla frutescens var. hirtella TaxID=608512 RepID=A0AAD4J1B3_PERFH|nr:hypothetical protein C2S53_007025 [Perilla frutescens var. hirtella]